VTDLLRISRPAHTIPGMANEVLSETREQVGIVRINRPDKLNALNLATMDQIVVALERFDADGDVRCMLITGDARAFAAGADITEMADASLVDMYYRNQFARWERIRRIQKPIVAAVSGYALGGGCELMMHCDIVVASETARIGQPEINIGVMPGAGGTQRTTRSIGKALAMDMVLTGRMLNAREALQAGLVSRIVPAEHHFDEAMKICQELCTRPPLALRLAKEAVLKAFETPLAEGLEYERKLFYMLFATQDQKEGMQAFLEKRPPVFMGK
jgi:enoyl-CoA hydratase